MNVSALSHVGKNVQVYQTAFLMVVLNLGILVFGIYFDYIKFITVFASCIFFDAIFLRMRYGKWSFPYSGVNAGFGISFFLRTDYVIFYMLAAFLAISSKYLFRVDERHFFNPSNFGVVAVIVFFPLLAWTNPLQWGIHMGGTLYFYLLYLLILLLGALIIWRVWILKKINLLWIVLPFLATHFLLYAFFTKEVFGASTWTWYSPSFFIFLFFMITDPMTVLDNKYSRFLSGVCIALGAYILQYFINENYTHLISLFLLTLMTPLMRKLDAKKLTSQLTQGNIFMIVLVVSMIIGFLVCIFLYDYPDLVFDNRCRKLFCTS